MLEMFLEHRAITQEQFDKSLHDLTEKMGMQNILLMWRDFEVDTVK